MLDIGPHRAPGPDGFSAAFYHQYSEDIKPEIIDEVRSFFVEDAFDGQLNHTNICLIPKVYPPSDV